MKPLQHAKISAKKHGGKWEDYIDIHEFFDQTKAQVPDMRHRAILHNSMGIFICAQVFGEVRTNSAGREYSVRDIGEDHVLEDLGTIPTLVEVINCIDTKHLKWLGGLPKNKRTLVAKLPKPGSGRFQEASASPEREEGASSVEQTPGEPVECQECHAMAPSGTHPALMSHEETCPVLERAAEAVKDLDMDKIMEQTRSPGVHPARPSRDMVLDGGGAYYRANRSRVID